MTEKSGRKLRGLPYRPLDAPAFAVAQALRKARHALDDEAFRVASPVQSTIGGVGAALGSADQSPDAPTDRGSVIAGAIEALSALSNLPRATLPDGLPFAAHHLRVRLERAKATPRPVGDKPDRRAADDEFFSGIWWVPDDAPGILRPATGSECAAEIRRLRDASRGALRTMNIERRWRCECGCEWPLTDVQISALPAVPPRCPLCTLNQLPIVAISDELLCDPPALSKILGDRLDEGAIILQREKP